MKKIFTTLTVILASFSAYTQALEIEQIKANENAKSGNYKDILSSMFQLASTNFTGNNKTIEFNSTLFALKAKANKSTNYNNYKQKFERNFQFNFKVQLDSVFKYNGFNGGITYAIVNERDKHVADFANSELSKLFNEVSDEIMINQLPILVKAGHSMVDISPALEKILNKEPEANFTPNELAVKKDLLANLDSKLYRTPKTLKDRSQIANSEEAVNALHTLREKYYQDMESKALWTIAADGTAGKEGKFNKASIESIFLKGNKTAWNEIDVRAKLIYADTLLTEHLPRTSFNAKAGMNFKIGKNTNQQSYFEIKVYGEYNKIFNNLMVNEEESTFLANADIRVRLTNDLWFPITIKYDTERSNFLGFLNITYNFGGI